MVKRTPCYIGQVFAISELSEEIGDFDPLSLSHMDGLASAGHSY